MNFPHRAPGSASGAKIELPAGKAALIIAHPGHELRVHGWLELARPTVFVLTDGSGHTGQSRLNLTSQILARAGATADGVYGRITDAALYTALIDHCFAPFFKLIEELSQALIREKITYVVGDASENYNPGHEVCRLLINAAVERANRATGRQMSNFDFLLVGPPDDCPAQLRSRAIWLELDDEAWERKLAAARGYSAIAGDVNAALDGMGTEAFRIECLRPADTDLMRVGPRQEVPFYERYGEQQVAAGYYRRVLRYREHLMPLAAALNEHQGK
jgi:hypothetical protein